MISFVLPSGELIKIKASLSEELKNVLDQLESKID
jgi:hypothetical protein